MMRRAFLFFCLAWLVGCASSYQVKEGTTPSSDRLFPDGTYRHDVTLSLPNGQQHHFQGVVKLAPDKIEVVGLSFFNTTVFRVIDDRKGGEPDVHIYVPQLKSQEDKVRSLFGTLRDMLLLPPGEIEKRELPGGAKVSVANYDEKHIPRNLKIEGPKFTVDVKVIGYEI